MISQPSDFDRAGLFSPTGPIDPCFMQDALRSLMRTTPLASPTEPAEWAARRMHAALIALTALQPRDPIEVLLGVQAVATHHAIMTNLYLGMNSKRPRGDSSRHFTSAYAGMRALDITLKSLERRQSKPLPEPLPAHEPRVWNNPKSTQLMQQKGEEFIADNQPLHPRPKSEPVTLTDKQRKRIERITKAVRQEEENDGLDIENIPGVLPGGGMIMPEDPTPAQKDYLERRLKLIYDAEWADLKRQGIYKFPMVRPLRAGDYVP